jgi:hypothetical protein
VSKIDPCVIVSYFTIQPLNEMVKVTFFIKGAYYEGNPIRVKPDVDHFPGGRS